MLVPINVVHLHRKVRCKEQGSKQFQSKKKKSGLSSEFNTHADVCRG